MSIDQPDGGDGAADRFEYFMIRVTRSEQEPDRVAGLIERLGSGEKWSFETVEQLVRLVGGRATFDPNMPAGTGDRNRFDQL